MKKENISMVIFFIMGIVTGGVSFLVENSYYAVILMVMVFLSAESMLKKSLKVEEGMKWFMKNGGMVYIFIWFISWVVLLNLFPPAVA